MNSKVIQGHIRPLLYQNHSSTFVYRPILMKIGMNANIMKTDFFHKCHFNVMEKLCDFFTLRSSNLITNLTYVLMDNFVLALFSLSFTLSLSLYLSLNMYYGDRYPETISFSLPLFSLSLSLSLSISLLIFTMDNR